MIKSGYYGYYSIYPGDAQTVSNLARPINALYDANFEDHHVQV